MKVTSKKELAAQVQKWNPIIHRNCN